jgi:hypothetical protein
MSVKWWSSIRKFSQIWWYSKHEGRKFLSILSCCMLIQILANFQIYFVFWIFFWIFTLYSFFNSFHKMAKFCHKKIRTIVTLLSCTVLASKWTHSIRVHLNVNLQAALTCSSSLGNATIVHFPLPLQGLHKKSITEHMLMDGQH